jgi:hypothetical protein
MSYKVNSNENRTVPPGRPLDREVNPHVNPTQRTSYTLGNSTSSAAQLNSTVTSNTAKSK